MYTIELSFLIPSSRIDQLVGIGNSIERGIGYMRSLLPSEPGFVTARAMYTIDDANTTQVVFHSVWEEWQDLENHRHSYLDERRLIKEFTPALSVENINIRIYSEVP